MRLVIHMHPQTLAGKEKRFSFKTRTYNLIDEQNSYLGVENQNSKDIIER